MSATSDAEEKVPTGTYARGYAPVRDFCKPSRDRIASAFAEGWETDDFRRSVREVPDVKNVENHEQA